MSKEPLPLFRIEALEGVRPKAYGRTILVRPLSFSVLTTAAFLFAGVIIGFFYWGHYTQHTTLSGQLVPTTGVISVLSPRVGTIVEKHVAEGDVVEANQILYLVSRELYNESGSAVEQTAIEQLELQEKLMLHQMERVQLLEAEERNSLVQTINSLQMERANIALTLASAQARLTLSEKTLERFTQLADSGGVSKEQLATTEGSYIDIKTRVQTTQRADIALSRQIGEAQAKLKTVSSRYASQVSDLERMVSAGRSGLSEKEARRLTAIRAPARGIATTVIGEIGQVADPARPLLAIIPENAVLEAQLLAPTRAIGFAHIGSTVMLRYDAYPYQRFGHHKGALRFMSRAPVVTGESTVGANGKASEPLYIATVTLPSQSVIAYGNPHKLEAGMLVQADVLQDTRRIYEWVLEPLYSLTGRLHPEGDAAAPPR
jgi:membrane fusion protein